MAKLWITEFDRIALDAGLAAPMMAQTPALTTQVVTYSTSTQSAAFGASTKFVRVVSDTNCHILFGSSPTATTSNMRIAADSAEYFGVVAGQKIAAITA